MTIRTIHSALTESKIIDSEIKKMASYTDELLGKEVRLEMASYTDELLGKEVRFDIEHFVIIKESTTIDLDKQLADGIIEDLKKEAKKELRHEFCIKRALPLMILLAFSVCVNIFFVMTS